MDKLVGIARSRASLPALQSTNFASRYHGRYDMNNKERLALADRVQQIIQNQQPQYHINKEREKIEKEFSRKKF